MMELGTDGAPWDEDNPRYQAAIEDGTAWACEFCHRIYPDDARLKVPASGSEETCIHCFFNGLHAGCPDFDAEDAASAFRKVIDANRDRIGGVLGYLERCLSGHVAAPCPWARSCYLCDAKGKQLDPKTSNAVEAWLRTLGLLPRPKMNPKQFRKWDKLDATSKLSLLAEFATHLTSYYSHYPTKPVFAAETRPSDIPILVHRASGVSFVVIPDSRPNAGAFLIAVAPLTRREAATLGLSDTTAAGEDERFFTGFDLHAFSSFWVQTPFRTPTAAEHAAATHYDPALVRTIRELSGLRDGEIETIDPGGHTYTSPLERLEARDSIGRLIPVRVPTDVGMRLAIDIQ